jgi:hypothetical protein
MKAKLLAVTLLITLAGCTGGGETVVSGFGNSGNFFGVDAEAEMLARVLSQDPNVPNVKDEDLLRIFDVVLASALDGDIRSSVVIYKLASRQREQNEEE